MSAKFPRGGGAGPFLARSLYKSNVFSHFYQLDQSISILGVVGWCFSLFFTFYLNILRANIGYPDETPRSKASDLVLHRLPMSHKNDARLIRVK